MIRIGWIALLLMMIAVTWIRAAEKDESWMNVFEKKTYVNADNRTLPYRLLRPEKVEPGKKYPLVLFLHGLGERGDDNVQQIAFYFAKEWTQPERRAKYPCFIVAPQCPKTGHWSNIESRSKNPPLPEKPLDPLDLALEMLDQVVEDLPVDRDRIYITGLSMGGYGTWEAGARRPEFFAAARPGCGGGDPAQASKLKRLPIWAFHGDQDTTVPPARSLDMIEALRRAGGEPKLTIYPGVKHNSWDATYADPEVWAWLFAQKRR